MLIIVIFLILVCLDEISTMLFDEKGNIIPNIMNLSEQKYFCAGKIMALSLAHEGSNPTLLSPEAFDIICKDNVVPGHIKASDEFLKNSEVANKVCIDLEQNAF